MVAGWMRANVPRMNSHGADALWTGCFPLGQLGVQLVPDGFAFLLKEQADHLQIFHDPHFSLRLRRDLSGHPCKANRITCQ